MSGPRRRVGRRHAARLAPSDAGLTLYTEPRAGIGPIVASMRAARRSIELSMYELSDNRIERALAAAASRGVKVRVILDEHGYEPGRVNATARSYLLAHRVLVRYAPPRYAFDHEKALAIDGDRAFVMTLNFTPRYYASDRDFVVLDERRVDVSRVEAIFEEDWRSAGGHPRPTKSPHDTSRTYATSRARRGSGAPGRAPQIVVSPRTTPALLGLLAAARRRVQIESEELEDPAIVEALCTDARRGVRLEVTMTFQRSSQTSLARVQRCGGRVRLYSQDARIYIHAKAIVVDRRVAFIGSQNLSVESLVYNRELGIVFSAPPIVESLSATLAFDFVHARPLASPSKLKLRVPSQPQR